MTTDGGHADTFCLVAGTTGPSAGWLRGNFGLSIPRAEDRSHAGYGLTLSLGQ
jgi:hypothetical protein